MTDAQRYLVEKGQQTVAAWKTAGFAALHDLRPDPAKDRARAAGVLAALVQTYGDAFVARQIGAYQAWCVSHPAKIKGRTRHDDSVRKWATKAAEDAKAKMPGPKGTEKPAYPETFGKTRYDCPPCGWVQRTDFTTYQQHLASCEKAVAARAMLTPEKMRADLIARGWGLSESAP